MVLLAGLNVAGSSVRAGETNTGVDGYFTVLTLKEREEEGNELLNIGCFSIKRSFHYSNKDETLSDHFTAPVRQSVSLQLRITFCFCRSDKVTLRTCTCVEFFHFLLLSTFTTNISKGTVALFTPHSLTSVTCEFTDAASEPK